MSSSISPNDWSYQTYVGVPLADIPLDREVGRIASQNPDYREVIVREGLNPVAPPNSVEIKRTVSNETRLITVIYGILATDANSSSVDYGLAADALSQPPAPVTITSALSALKITDPTTAFAQMQDQSAVAPIAADQAPIVEEQSAEIDLFWITVFAIIVALALGGFLIWRLVKKNKMNIGDEVRSAEHEVIDAIGRAGAGANVR